MKVSVNWLRELVDTDLAIDALAQALTMGGLEQAMRVLNR